MADVSTQSVSTTREVFCSLAAYRAFSHRNYTLIRFARILRIAMTQMPTEPDNASVEICSSLTTLWANSDVYMILTL